jgi:hypothetical protein
MELYTIVMDYRGGTYISQIWAENIDTACKLWAENINIEAIQFFKQKLKNRLITEIVNEKPIKSDGAVNVWFVLAKLNNFFAHINIIKTDAKPC